MRFSVANQSPDDQVVQLFRDVTGRSGFGSRRTRAFLKVVKFIEPLTSWEEDIISDFRDTPLLTKAIEASSRHSLGPSAGLPVDCRNVSELPDGYFSLDLGPQWATLRQRFRSQRGDDLNQGHLLVHFADMITDLQFAARLNAEVSTSALGSELLTLKCKELARVAGANLESVSTFQQTVLNGVNIRQAINSGSRNLSDLMRLLDRADAFKSWIADKPIESDLVAAYVKEATAHTWAENLPTKVLRVVLPTALTAALSGHTGIAASLGSLPPILSCSNV